MRKAPAVHWAFGYTCSVTVEKPIRKCDLQKPPFAIYRLSNLKVYLILSNPIYSMFVDNVLFLENLLKVG